MQEIYSTSDVANIIGIHPNTVRLYEDLKLITAPERKANGYRVFTKLHIQQFQIARIALQVEILQNGLRKHSVEIIKATANKEFDLALQLTQDYTNKVNLEIEHAQEAIRIVEEILSGRVKVDSNQEMTRKETALYLNITMDTLRNWEMNGLFTVKRKQNGYRVYTDADIKQLKIIRSLRCANYSLSAILRMLTGVSKNPNADIRTMIDTPFIQDDIISACDMLLTSLHRAKGNAQIIYSRLTEMKKENNPPL